MEPSDSEQHRHSRKLQPRQTSCIAPHQSPVFLEDVPDHDRASFQMALSRSDRARVVKMERNAIGWVSMLRTPASSERILSPSVSSEKRVSMNETTLPTARTHNQSLGSGSGSDAGRSSVTRTSRKRSVRSAMVSLNSSFPSSKKPTCVAK